MSVTFSVSGSALRPFLSAVQCAARLGDGVFFVAHQTYLEISSLSSTSSCHLLSTVPADTLGGYRFTEVNGASQGDKQVFFYLLTRSLQATVLHQSAGNLISISVSFSLTPQEGDQLTDSVKWDCERTGGVLKTFHLRTATAVPKRVSSDGTSYPFRICGDPQTFGYLLRSLPGNPRECIIFPLSNRIELRFGQGSTKTSNRFGDMPSAASTAVVSAYPANFDSFEFTAAEQGNLAESVLPGKIVELKPIRVASMLCKELGLHMELGSGYERAPVVIRSLTYGEARQMAEPQPHFGGGPSDIYTPISFVMHIAGLDVSYSDVGDTDSRRDTVGGAARQSAPMQQPVMTTQGEPVDDFGEQSTTEVPATLSLGSAGIGTPSMVPRTVGTTKSGAGSGQPSAPPARNEHSADAAGGHKQHSAPDPSGQNPSQVTHVDASFISGSATTSEAGNTARRSQQEPFTQLTPKDTLPSENKVRSSSHRNTAGSVVGDSQVTSGRQSMTALYPLDFEAFTKGTAEEDKEEIDEELQRFLDSCTAILMGEADKHEGIPNVKGGC